MIEIKVINPYKEGLQGSIKKWESIINALEELKEKHQKERKDDVIDTIEVIYGAVIESCGLCHSYYACEKCPLYAKTKKECADWEFMEKLINHLTHTMYRKRFPQDDWMLCPPLRRELNSALTWAKKILNTLESLEV
ncbi:MAG: hypothetical protein WC476_01570 [Phycisphaerae bacterium]|jgi:hypothetical protein